MLHVITVIMVMVVLVIWALKESLSKTEDRLHPWLGICVFGHAPARVAAADWTSPAATLPHAGP